MKVLYVYPETDDMVTRHVSILKEGMQNSVEVKIADSYKKSKEIIKSWRPDIVHCHGCWTYWVVKAGNHARKQGARVVLSPHGQLEPWIMERKTLQEKLPKTALWEKSFVEKAYSIISFGKMEQMFLNKLGWNPRVEIIKNCVITNSLSSQEMCSQTFSIYQKVMDSNVLELMDEDTIRLMGIIIKASIMGDSRWVDATYPDLDAISWRQMLVYAEHENVKNYVDYGINILGLKAKNIDTDKIDAYFPPKYKKPQPIKTIIGEYKGDETDYLIRMIRQIQKEPLLLHRIELTRELYRENVNDDSLAESLEEKKLTKYTSRLISILCETTLLDEGYIPLEPTDDRGTKLIRNSIYNHLKI